MIRILSANIRTSLAKDGENDWTRRRELCAEVIERQRADVVCFQEMTGEQLEYLASRLPAYAAVCALDRPGVGWPVNTVFYRRGAFRPRSIGAYWLSETPHVPGSRSWESDCIRLATWVHLAPADGSPELRILNTHLDHVSQRARENQARLLEEDAAAWPPDFSQILTGDMNCSSSNPALRLLLDAGWRDSYAEVHGTLEPGPTFHRFQGPACAEPLGTIDWILCRGPVRALQAAIVRDSSGGRYPSDHYFVSADLEPGSATAPRSG